MINGKKVGVVMPAYNVAKVLKKTIDSLPQGFADEIIIVNDGSSDDTAKLAQQMGLRLVSHPKNRGYGGAQKTGYETAIQLGLDAVVMVHGDNQYDPSFSRQFAEKICSEGYDVVSGTRMVLGDVLKHGMPIWKFIPNRCLTWLENVVFCTNLTDYHNGYRAYKVSFLKQVPFAQLSEKYDFDTDIIIQAAIRKAKIAEIPHPTRYLDENSQMSFSKGVRYGLSILRTIGRYLLHVWGIKKDPLFAGV